MLFGAVHSSLPVLCCFLLHVGLFFFLFLLFCRNLSGLGISGVPLGEWTWGRGSAQTQEAGLPHWVENSGSQVPGVWSRRDGGSSSRWTHLLGPMGKNKNSQRRAVECSKAPCLMQGPWIPESKDEPASCRLWITGSRSSTSCGSYVGSVLSKD